VNIVRDIKGELEEEKMLLDKGINPFATEEKD
jgi:hypothetical protein